MYTIERTRKGLLCLIDNSNKIISEMGDGGAERVLWLSFAQQKSRTLY
jgi:hypothetical protein